MLGALHARFTGSPLLLNRPLAGSFAVSRPDFASMDKTPIDRAMRLIINELRTPALAQPLAPHGAWPRITQTLTLKDLPLFRMLRVPLRELFWIFLYIAPIYRCRALAGAAAGESSTVFSAGETCGATPVSPRHFVCTAYEAPL